MTSDPATPSRWSWLDRWLEPPWRALVTWMVLAGISGVVLDDNLGIDADRAIRFAVNQLDRVASGRLPPILQHMIVLSNANVLAVWYQPLMLRLGILRWIVWIGGVALIVATLDFYSGFFGDDFPPFGVWTWPTTAGILLIGCRSRPWLSLPAGALSCGVAYWLGRFPGLGSSWFWLTASNLPYATVMLYGTQRLPRRKEPIPVL